MGETRVDLLHLLEDLRDAYPGSTEETILTEIVANALDSGAATITIVTDPAAPALTITDDGAGMRRRDLARYHDIASSTKTRGAGIGFAGVGIKIALLVCAEVITETRRGKHHVASSWRLASRQKAPWHWTPPAGLVAARGTAVRLTPASALSPLLDPGFIEGALRRHFAPLMDPAVADMLRDHYPSGVTFVLNGQALDAERAPGTDTAPIAIRVGRKRKPAGAGYLVREPASLPEERRGLAISTFGKVIKRGWDWLAIAPATPERIGGLIEVPALAECLTLNKADFIRAGARGATYLAYRKAIQEAVAQQLAAWGDAPEPAEQARRRAARPVERDLESVLADLSDDFPLLAALVEKRAGGQRRLAAAGGRATDNGGEPALVAGDDAAHAANALAAEPALHSARTTGTEPVARERPDDRSNATPASAATVAAPASTRGSTTRERRPARYGLGIQFESRPDDPELAQLVESTVWVNEAHPAYRRAVASRSEGYHIALAVAMALAPLAVDPAKEHGFITAFLARWGAALERRKARRRD
ncbi:MAG: ATP-binding protein [Candidatus Rokubacteria bacterium]|nr:ATP-binding protein [Candidatus Rokubacteria bacterium]